MPGSSPSRRAFLLRLAATALVLQSACARPSAHTQQKKAGPTRSPALARKLPAPLDLPKQPAVVVHLARPHDVDAQLRAWLPADWSLRQGLAAWLRAEIHPHFANEILGAVDESQSISFVALAGSQEVIRLSLTSAGRQKLNALFARLDANGDFGAKYLPGVSKGKAVVARGRFSVWLDPDDPRALALATSTRGLVTAAILPANYGDSPIVCRLDRDTLRELDAFPDNSIPASFECSGTVSSLSGNAYYPSGKQQDPFAGLPIAPGTFGPLVVDTAAAWAASTTYTQYQQLVAQGMAEVRRNLGQLPSLLRSVGKDLENRIKSLAGRWNGKTLVGGGPPGHLRLVLGMNDASRGERELQSLIDTVDKQLELVSSFVGNLPTISRKSAGKIGSFSLTTVKFGRLRNQIPREYHSLLGGDGSLKITFVWLSQHNALALVIGSAADQVLKRWLGQVDLNQAPTGNQLASLWLAVDPKQVQIKQLDSATVARLLTIAPNLATAFSAEVMREPAPGSYRFSLHRNSQSKA